MNKKASLLSLVDKKSFEAKVTEAREHDQINGMTPAVFAYKDLDGELRLGFNYQPLGAKVGDRFHIDHGVGINRNEDGEVLWVYSPEEDKAEEALTKKQRSDLAYRAVLAHSSYAGLDTASMSMEDQITELMKGMRSLCSDYCIDFSSFFNEPLTLPSIINYPMPEVFAELADQEGWGLFERESGISLCRNDEAKLLKDDTEAWDFVIRKAMTGSEFHIAVIAGIKQQNPDEYTLWVNESRVFNNYHFHKDFTNNKEQALKNLGL
ncbi:hypothetical protein F0M16_11010 [Vibrio cholerae]|uniref:Uncharacterized protein n=1 Tax=Vibrio cholerae TaxID=666 RepID=A0A5Q6PIT6_VIBCL|nr:hypothetical protein [Vibrio cholerae]KAA1254788.1 hypothetical protein F0M16_11010 [Vibrio cholerae]